MEQVGWKRRAAIGLASIAAVVGVVVSQAPALAAEGAWAATGSLNVPRLQATTTLLDNGRALVAGGRNFAFTASHKSAELYDPLTGAFALTGSMTSGRWSHTATLLPNGKVLVAGGYTDPTTGANAQPVLRAAELYDPATGSWSITGSMTTPRALHVAQLLTNGKVLVAGGRTCNGAPPVACDSSMTTSTAELYDPATGSWAPTASMNSNRTTTSAVLLPSGKVLVPAGFPGGQNTADTYDPAAGTWTSTGPLLVNRARQGAMRLPDGTALVAAGSTGAATLTSETYDPATNGWTRAGNVAQNRFNYFFTELPNGKVLIAGGAGGATASTTAEVYAPSTRTWADAGTLPSAQGSSSSNGNSTRAVVLSADPRAFRFDPAVCGANCGKVLVVGDNPAGAAALYSPATVSLAVCTTTVTGTSGPVTVPAGQVTCINDATVQGSVTVQPGGALVMNASKVFYGVSAQGVAGLRICGSQIAPSEAGVGLSVTGSFGPVVVGDGTADCPRTDISKNVAFAANQSVRFDSNRVTGGVSVVGTASAPVVAANQIVLGLDCTNNTPPPTNEGRANTVLGARTGQCSSL